MKQTTFTKPLVALDNLPTRTTDSITITEDNGSIVKIERAIGGKIEEIGGGGNIKLLLATPIMIDNVFTWDENSRYIKFF